jgi:hypothetical protein
MELLACERTNRSAECELESPISTRLAGGLLMNHKLIVAQTQTETEALEHVTRALETAIA